MTTSQRSASLQINKGLPRQLFNRFVGLVLRSPLHSLFGFSRVGMLLSYTGKKSGKSYTLPLAYVREGNTITTFALFTNTVWWKNLRGGVPVTVRVEGRDQAGTATVIEGADVVAQGLLAMSASNPQMARNGYYALPRLENGTVDAAALREAAKTRVMIQIQLHE